MLAVAGSLSAVVSNLFLDCDLLLASSDAACGMAALERSPSSKWIVNLPFLCKFKRHDTDLTDFVEQIRLESLLASLDKTGKSNCKSLFLMLSPKSMLFRVPPLLSSFSGYHLLPNMFRVNFIFQDPYACSYALKSCASETLTLQETNNTAKMYLRQWRLGES